MHVFQVQQCSVVSPVVSEGSNMQCEAVVSENSYN